MGRRIEVLGAQVRPEPWDPAGSLARFEDHVMTGTSRFRADLLVFPELFLMGEDPFSGREPAGFVNQVAEEIPGPLTDKVGKIAARAKRWIVAGSILERSGSHVFNTAIVFAPDGSLAARYRKLMPWAPWEETTPGDATSVFDIEGVGRAGLMVCYDGWFPEIGRALAQRGAGLIIHPSLTSTPDREEELVLARATAITNQCYVINVNAVSTIGGGRSLAADPEGRVLFEGGVGEELFVVSVDLDHVERVREHGTRGLSQVWRHFQEAPSAAFDAYRLRGEI